MTRQLTFTRRIAARGFTLIELVIALGIGVGILLALTLMFSSNSGNQQEFERTLRQVENSRFAMDTLVEDLQHAGFYSDFNPTAVLPDPLVTSPDPCAVATNAQGWAAPNPTGVPPTPLAYPLPVIGIAAGTAVNCLANRRANTEAIVIRHAETTGAATLTEARAGNLYIQTPRCRDELGIFRISAPPANSPEAVFNLRRANCGDPTDVNNEVRRLLQRTYYIATCNDCPNDGIPTLKRVEMVDGALRRTSIAEGVENLQFEFGVDNDADGTPDAWFTTAGLPAADWPNLVAPGVLAADNRRGIVSVRIHMLVRTTQQSPGFVETRTYRLGPAVTLLPGALNDGFKRAVLSTSVRLNNVGGRRE